MNKETYRNICDITHLINLALFDNLSSKIYFKQLSLKWTMTNLEKREILICSGKQFNKKSKTIQLSASAYEDSCVCKFFSKFLTPIYMGGKFAPPGSFFATAQKRLALDC